MTDTSPSVDRTTTPEASVALGVSSNSPSINGHAQEEDTPVNENDVDTEKKSFISIDDDSYYNNNKSITYGAGTKKIKTNNRVTTTPSKPYPFMGYQILPIIPQPVLFPVMPKNQFGYNQPSTQQSADLLSTTNLYIKGLPDNSTDNDLEAMCKQYGKIVSTKAILDKKTGICKGYGFVDFQDPSDAQKAVQCLQTNGVQAQFAKLQEQDPTNLYMSNLPKSYTEKHLEQMLSPYGSIISSRILRDLGGCSRGVGFVRLDSHEHCQTAIEKLSGTVLPGLCEALNIKFADGSTNKKKVTNFDMLAWKDYGVQDPYLYDVPSVLTPNGYVSSRLLSHNGGIVHSPHGTPYIQQSTGYQTNSNNGSSSPWQPTNQYYVSPGNISNDHIHGLTSQMNTIQLSSNTTNGGGNSYTSHDHHTNGNGVCPTQTAQYTQQPPGWTIRLSHPPPPPHYI